MINNVNEMTFYELSASTDINLNLKKNINGSFLGGLGTVAS